jgi:transcriptional regulator with XRE-family HTH domain
MTKPARVATAPQPQGAPGDAIRDLRRKIGLTLMEMSERTGLAVSTLSKLEKGNVSLSYDKILLLSRALGVDMAELLDASSHKSSAPPGGGGRRVVHRAGEGQLVETHSYHQRYMATELLNKRITPMVVELRARSMDEFVAEFGDFIRHAGEEFVYVLEGEVEFCSDLYAPVRLKAGDSIYFDSEMGHAYLKASDEPCRLVAVCSPRGRDELMMETFVNASQKRSAAKASVENEAATRVRRKVGSS